MAVHSKREKAKYVHNGYQYVFDKLTKDGSKKIWWCDRKDHGYKERLHTDTNTDAMILENPDKKFALSYAHCRFVPKKGKFILLSKNIILFQRLVYKCQNWIH